ANANENFCVMVARVQSNQISQSWIYMPLTGECLIAEAGQGAFLFDANGNEIKRLKTRDWMGFDKTFGRISFAYFSDKERRLIRERAERTLAHRKSIGSAGCEYAFVAKGELDYAIFNRLKVWDHVPGTLIVREAGGDCRMLTGEAYSPTDTKNGNMVGASAELNDAVLRLLFDPLLAKKPEDERTSI
ncbi:MAG: inositol monophosphatase family protein, partial [Alphaproteobacteria bacterium]